MIIISEEGVNPGHKRPVALLRWAQTTSSAQTAEFTGERVTSGHSDVNTVPKSNSAFNVDLPMDKNSFRNHGNCPLKKDGNSCSLKTPRGCKDYQCVTKAVLLILKEAFLANYIKCSFNKSRRESGR